MIKTFFTTISFIAVVVSLLMALLVYSRNHKNQLSKVFIVLCLSMAYWGFLTFQMRLAENFDLAAFWDKYNILWSFSVALMFHFVLIFTNQRWFLEKRLLLVLLYASALAFSLIDLFTEQITAPPVLEYWGWDSTATAPNTFVNNLKYVWLVAIGVAALYMVIRHYLRQVDTIAKRQSAFVAIGIFIPLGIGLIGEILTPLFNYKFPDLTIVAFAFGTSAFVGYAIWRYELFALTPADAADKIIQTMSDSLLLVSPEGNIVTVNQRALELLGYQEKELIGSPADRIFHNFRLDEIPIRDVPDAASPGMSDMETVLLTKEGVMIPVSISYSIMRGKDGRDLGSVLIARDITERKLAVMALRESESRLREIMESLQTGIAIIDPESHTIVDVNPVLRDMIGAPKEEIIGSVCHEFICPAEEGKCPITDLHQTIDHSERVLLNAKGEGRPILKSVTTVMLNGKPLLLESCTDITVRKQMEEQLRESLAKQEALVKKLDEVATHDGLTGLYNHRAFYMLLENEYTRAKRFHRPLSLLMLDIDHFKQVNDSYGHLSGDAILVGLGKVIDHQVRAIDHTCRYGGEEIMIILPEDDGEKALSTAERLRSTVEKYPFDIGSGSRVYITVSVGAASWPSDALNMQMLVAAADVAMFVAKKRGRNRVVRYEKAFRQPEEQ